MNFSRRELSLLLPALAATRAASQGSALKSKTYRFEDLAVRSEGENRFRAILEGETHTGVPIELHMTELAPGQAPHPPHHHVHEEMIMILEGTVEVNIGDSSATLGPGSVAFVASGQQHGWHNVGTSRARYFVLALGRDKA
ncbi:MAG: cupin domain-containing protein [Acidobacteriia bacterium]|nr:cupin domain-containing protein [Terriglobia bacterium]